MVRPPSPYARYALFALLAVFAAGCVTTPTKGGRPGTRRPSSGKSAPGKKSPSAKPAPRPASDPQAQQKLYDLGMKHYTEENYEEAQKAWKQAVALGPNTDLGQKSRENLKKTEQILSTLKEMGPR